MLIYHGSDHVVDRPEYGIGKKNNDYGLGFYCTESKDLALEWAVELNRDGYANLYELGLDQLKVLNLSDESFSILNWLAILLDNREFQISSAIGLEAKQYLCTHFMPKYRDFDVVRGYRADDSYFSFAKAFINNSLSLQQLEKAMRLGDLGEQIVLISNKAFDCIQYLECFEARSEIWYPRKQLRDESARRIYSNHTKIAFNQDDTYILEIMKGKMTNEDIFV